MSTRSQISTLITEKILTGGRRTTASNAREVYVALNESCINKTDDANVNNGYLAIDNTGKVDVSFIKKTTPTGQFLKDDGTWATPAGGGAVDSVNGQTGVVVLTAADVGAPSGSGSSTGTNTGDQDLSGYLPLAGGTMDNGAIIVFDVVDIQSGGVNDYTQGWYYADTSSASMGYNSTSDITAFNGQASLRATDGENDSQIVASNILGNRNAIMISSLGSITARFSISPEFAGVYSHDGNLPLNYQSDYSANYTNRSLTDKEYVDNVIGAFVNIRSIAKQTTDGTTLTGTTAETKQTAFLIPANTFVAGDVIELKFLARKVGTAGSGSILFYVNTSDTLSGATQISRLITGANTQLFIKARRDLVIKSATVTEYLPGATSSVNDYNTFTAAASQTNINWAVDQYIIPSLQLGNTADSITLSMVNIIKE